MNTKRLQELEKLKPDAKWPQFSDMYQTATATGWLEWMLLNNPQLTKQDILDLKVVHIDQMYRDKR